MRKILNKVLTLSVITAMFGIASATPVQASTGAVAFAKSFGGSNWDYFYSVKDTPDGGFVVAGASRSTDGDMQGLAKGKQDAILVKYDASGNVQWKKVFGGTGDDGFYSVEIAPDGGFVASGGSISYDGDMNGLLRTGYITWESILVKYDSNGNLLWKKAFGGMGQEQYNAVKLTDNGDFVAVGYSDSTDVDMAGLSKGGRDAIIVKYDSNGDVRWKQSFGGSDHDEFSSVETTADGGLIAVGYAQSTNKDMTGLSKGNKDAIFVKYDANGNLQWKKSYGGSNHDQFTFVKNTVDGGILAVGGSESTDKDMLGLNKGISDAILVKYGKDGNLKWTKSFGGSKYDSFTSFDETEDGGLVVSGISQQSSDGDLEGVSTNAGVFAFLSRFDSEGNVQWTNAFRPNSLEARFSSVQVLEDGNFITVGYNSSKTGDLEGVEGAGKAILIKNNDATTLSPATFTVDKTSPTNTDVVVAITYPAQATVKEYRIGTGEWQPYTNPVVVSNNDTVYARSKDKAGNSSDESSYVVNNIDKVAPVQASFAVSVTEPTNENVKVTIEFPEDATVKEYKLGPSGSWTSYVSPVVLTANVSVFARSKDAVGNLSEESNIVISNIDKELPTSPTINQAGNKISIQSGSDAESGVKETQVAVNNGAWSVYSSPLSLADGKYNIQAKTIDKAGNQSATTSVTYTLFDNALKTATNDVIKAEQEKSQEQVDKAKDLVVALPESPEKDALLDRLQDVQVQIDADKAIENATNEVIRAEQDKTQEQVDKAKDLVDALPASPEKDDLLDRLKDIQKQIDANNALKNATNEVIKAEQDKTQEQVDKAKHLVNVLPGSPEKTDLLDRLKIVEDQIALELATQKVVVAEQSRKQSDIDSARAVVNALSNSSDKQDLLDRLDAIVPDTGGTTPPTGEDEIIPNKDLPSEIGKLTDPADKATFSDILKAIERAEANPTNRVLVQLAWDKVKAVPDSVRNNMQNKKVYKSLYARAEKLKNDFNAGLEQEALQVAIKKATDYVTSYERYKLEYYKVKAQEAVNALPAGETKTALQARIDAVIPK